MKPRRFKLGDCVKDKEGRAGVVVEVRSITQGSRPHHRLKIKIAPFQYVEAGEHFFDLAGG